MNITLLSVKMMLNITARWLGHQKFRTKLLAAGALGKGILEELEGAHASLAELSHNRATAREQVQALIRLCGALDQLHDRKARGLYYLFSGLIEISEDAETIADYRQLQALLFPAGLRVVKLPYIEEGGAAVELDRAVGPKVREQLAALTAGGQTLEQVFDSWVKAGHSLGDTVRQRTELQASLTREGSNAADVDIRGGRKQWLQAVRGLLWAIEVRSELQGLAEPVEAALEAGIELGLRRRALAGAAAEVGELQVDDELEVEDELDLEEVDGLDDVEVDVELDVEVETEAEVTPEDLV